MHADFKPASISRRHCQQCRRMVFASNLATSEIYFKYDIVHIIWVSHCILPNVQVCTPGTDTITGNWDKINLP